MPHSRTRTFKSWLLEDGTRQYRIFYRVGQNRLSRLSDTPPEKKVKKVFFREPGRLAYDIRHKLLSQRPKS